MKHPFSVSKFCKIAGSQMCYEVVDNCLYLVDKRGSLGVTTTDLSVLDDLKGRSMELEERPGVGDLLHRASDFKISETVHMYDSGITFQYRYYGEKMELVAMFDTMKRGVVKFAQQDRIRMFTAEAGLIATSTDMISPFLIYPAYDDEDFLAVIMPIKTSANEPLREQFDLLRRAF
jgi:hypothetical protein